MKKVLIYTDCYIYGGSERLMVALLQNIELNKNYNIVLAYRNHNEYKSKILKDIDFGSKTKLISLNSFSFDNYYYYLVKNLKNIYLRKIFIYILKIIENFGIHKIFNYVLFSAVINREKPDIVHINNGGYPGARSCNHFAFISKMMNVKKVIYQVNNQAKRGLYFSFIRNYILSNCVDEFIIASKKGYENLKFIFPYNKINLVYNTVLSKNCNFKKSEIISNLNISENSLILLNIGFLDNRKGQIIIIKALKKIIENNINSNIVLLIVGDGILYNQFTSFIKKNNLERYIYLLGYKDDYYKYLSCSDIFLFPSLYDEDMPLVIIEAIMKHKPIITTTLFENLFENTIDDLLVNINLSENEMIDKYYNLILNFDRNRELLFDVSKKLMLISDNFSEIKYANNISKIYN